MDVRRGFYVFTISLIAACAICLWFFLQYNTNSDVEIAQDAFSPYTQGSANPLLDDVSMDEDSSAARGQDEHEGVEVADVRQQQDDSKELDVNYKVRTIAAKLIRFEERLQDELSEDVLNVKHEEDFEEYYRTQNEYYKLLSEHHKPMNFIKSQSKIDAFGQAVVGLSEEEAARLKYEMLSKE